ncbi:hypothetical protein CLF_101791, partial [Clonorchis sinensis]
MYFSCIFEMRSQQLYLNCGNTTYWGERHTDYERNPEFPLTGRGQGLFIFFSAYEKRSESFNALSTRQGNLQVYSSIDLSTLWCSPNYRNYRSAWHRPQAEIKLERSHSSAVPSLLNPMNRTSYPYAFDNIRNRLGICLKHVRMHCVQFTFEPVRWAIHFFVTRNNSGKRDFEIHSKDQTK